MSCCFRDYTLVHLDPLEDPVPFFCTGAPLGFSRPFEVTVVDVIPSRSLDRWSLAIPCATLYAVRMSPHPLRLIPFFQVSLCIFIRVKRCLPTQIAGATLSLGPETDFSVFDPLPVG